MWILLFVSKGLETMLIRKMMFVFLEGLRVSFSSPGKLARKDLMIIKRMRENFVVGNYLFRN